MNPIIIILILLLLWCWSSKEPKKEQYRNPVVLGLKYPTVPNYANYTQAPYSGYNYDVNLKYFYRNQ